MKPGIGRVRCVEKVGTPPDREEKPLAPLPPGRCRRCGEEKSWLRPGETCAPCLASRGLPTRVVDEDEEDEVETITLPTNGVYSTGDIEPPASGGTILRTCPVCHEAFEANGSGRPRVYCSMFCKRKQARAGGSPAPRAETKPSPAPVAERATCPVCGDEFATEPGRVNCSRACTVRAAELRRQERMRAASGKPPRERLTRNCAVCDREFTPWQTRSTYCSSPCAVRAMSRRAQNLPVRDAVVAQRPRKRSPGPLAPIREHVPKGAVVGFPGLAAWRLLHGVSQVRAAELLGVTERTVVRWEVGATTPPPELAEKIRALIGAPSAPVDSKPEKAGADAGSEGGGGAAGAAAPAHPGDGGWSLIREIGRAFLARVHAQETAGRRS